jgi:hypothetical protein
MNTTGRGDLVLQRVAGIEVGGQPQVEHVEQLADRRGGARAAEDHQVVRAAAAGLVDDPAGLLAETRGLRAGPRGLRVGVGIQRHHLVADELLDEAQRAARRGVVGVRDAARPVGTVEDLVVPDDRLADGFDEAVARVHGHSVRKVIIRGLERLRPDI